MKELLKQLEAEIKSFPLFHMNKKKALEALTRFADYELACAKEDYQYDRYNFLTHYVKLYAGMLQAWSEGGSSYVNTSDLFQNFSDELDMVHKYSIIYNYLESNVEYEKNEEKKVFHVTKPNPRDVFVHLGRKFLKSDSFDDLYMKFESLASDIGRDIIFYYEDIEGYLDSFSSREQYNKYISLLKSYSPFHEVIDFGTFTSEDVYSFIAYLGLRLMIKADQEAMHFNDDVLSFKNFGLVLSKKEFIEDAVKYTGVSKRKIMEFIDILSFQANNPLFGPSICYFIVQGDTIYLLPLDTDYYSCFDVFYALIFTKKDYLYKYYAPLMKLCKFREASMIEGITKEYKKRDNVLIRSNVRYYAEGSNRANAEYDIVFYDTISKTLMLVECKWYNTFKKDALSKKADTAIEDRKIKNGYAKNHLADFMQATFGDTYPVTDVKEIIIIHNFQDSKEMDDEFPLIDEILFQILAMKYDRIDEFYDAIISRDYYDMPNVHYEERRIHVGEYDIIAPTFVVTMEKLNLREERDSE